MGLCDFSRALEKMQQGFKVAREGWNGKGMWITIIRGSDPEQTCGDYSVNGCIWDGECLPWIGMKTADDKFVPWHPSQVDMLAGDWDIVD
jgi:hypothetical protein